MRIPKLICTYARQNKTGAKMYHLKGTLVLLRKRSMVVSPTFSTWGTICSAWASPVVVVTRLLRRAQKRRETNLQ